MYHLFNRGFNLDIAVSIRVWIAKRNTSQTKLAKKVGVTRPYMSSLCTGGKIPSTGLIERISKALDIEVSELIKAGEE